MNIHVLTRGLFYLRDEQGRNSPKTSCLYNCRGFIIEEDFTTAKILQLKRNLQLQRMHWAKTRRGLA
jgi:hypothetical protein